MSLTYILFSPLRGDCWPGTEANCSKILVQTHTVLVGSDTSHVVKGVVISPPLPKNHSSFSHVSFVHLASELFVGDLTCV